MRHQDVLTPPGQAAIIMVLGLLPGKTAEAKAKHTAARIGALVRSMRGRMPASEASCVMGFGAEAFARLYADLPMPRELAPFTPIQGARHVAVSTPGDLFFHLRAASMDVCCELAGQITGLLDGAFTPVEELHCFRYFDGRTIIGFVDGTENPTDDDRAFFGLIGEEDPTFAGGSYVFVQKYLHDMAAWNAISVEEQESVIGRRKFDDQELADEVKPATAHNAVTNISDAQGRELKIIRANLPFANPSRGEFGTCFIGYSSTFSTTRTMLERMFKGDDAGNTDRLLDFSTPVTGTLFFVPTTDMLDELGE